MHNWPVLSELKDAHLLLARRSPSFLLDFLHYGRHWGLSRWRLVQSSPLRDRAASNRGHSTPEKGFACKLEVGKIAKAWNFAIVQSDVKMKADAAARAHGVPISLLEPDWASLMNTSTAATIQQMLCQPSLSSSRSKRCSQTGP